VNAMERRRINMRALNDRLRAAQGEVLSCLANGKNYVPGCGSAIPRFVIVGEAPGRTENILRKPFCGPSGKLLDELLWSVGLGRPQVYVTNVVKWWPTEGNEAKGQTRPPTALEKAACRNALHRELMILDWPPVVALGSHARGAFLPGNLPRAVWHRATVPMPLVGRAKGLGNEASFDVIPLYHPAVGRYRHSMRPLLLKEFQMLLEAPSLVRET